MPNMIFTAITSLAKQVEYKQHVVLVSVTFLESLSPESDPFAGVVVYLPSL
jgi:hypothetical protein